MAITVTDVEDLLAVLRDHPEWRQRVRLEILGEELLSIPERMAGFEERMARLEEQMVRLAEGQEILQRGQEALQRGQVALEAAVLELKNSHGGRLDNLEGRDDEARYDAVGHVAERLRRPQRVRLGDLDVVLDARDEGRLTATQVANVRAADFIVRARRDTGPDAPVVHVVIEVSVTIHDSDVNRASDRAGILRSVGLDALAWVGGKSIGPGARLLADQLGVEVILDRDDEPADAA
jgi:hypothetical protein